jgi:sporulation protein YqfC
MKKNKSTRDKGVGKENVKSKVSGKKTKNTKEEKNHRKTMKEKFTELLELPKELVLDIPKITVVGKGDMMIENYKGIIEYGSGRVRINTGIGTVKISGAGLFIKEITSEDIIISGGIQTLEFD